MKFAKSDNLADTPAIADYEAKLDLRATSKPLKISINMKHPENYLIKIFRYAL